MGWFTEQIRQRTENDQNVLEDSFFRMASVVMDKWDANRLEDERLIAKEAIDAYGPMLGYLKEAGTAVALLPGTIYGYYFKDPATGKRTRITRKTARLFSREALCFYQPLPMKKLGIPDLLKYMKNSITYGDLVVIVLATLAVQLVGMIEPRVYSLVTGKILEGHNMNLMAGVGVFLLTSAFNLPGGAGLGDDAHSVPAGELFPQVFLRRAVQPGGQRQFPVQHDAE